MVYYGMALAWYVMICIGMLKEGERYNTWTTQEPVHRWRDHGGSKMNSQCKGQCGSGSLSPIMRWWLHDD